MKKLGTNAMLKLIPILAFLVAVFNIVVAIMRIIQGNVVVGCANIIVGIIFIAIAIYEARTLNPVRKLLKEYKELEEKYAKMSLEELSALDDSDLVEGVYTRLLKETEGEEDEQEYATLNDAKKVVYIIKWFHEEILNGGLCQYFVNSSRCTAPIISSYLILIGAEKYGEIYDKFIADNNINVDDLSEFIIQDIKEYSAQCEKYNFNEFDEKYYALDETDPLENYIAKYIREHLHSFELTV